MSKKDYEKAATIVQCMREEARTQEQVDYAKGALEGFLLLFGSEPRFDEARFRRACVPGANVRARKVVA